jgi:hypothetical protein
VSRRVVAYDFVEDWSTALREAMTESVNSIITVGLTLEQCKREAAHGQFGAVLEAAGISPRVAQMFMKVAANRVLSNPSTYSHLPAAYNSLYELSRLDEGRLEEVIADETITPGTTYSNIRTMVSREVEMAKNKALRDNPEQGPALPYRPESGPPAPAVYECQGCGVLVDPETLDTGDEVADIICPVCVECMQMADATSSEFERALDVARQEGDLSRENVIRNLGAPTSAVEPAVRAPMPPGMKHSPRRTNDEVLRNCVEIIGNAMLVSEIVSWTTEDRELRDQAAKELRHARTTISEMITALEAGAS